LIGTVINERYRIDNELGQGGLGIVYRSYDTLLQREVAIKVLHQEALGASGQSRLMREAQIVSRLNHPHIVTIYDAGEVGSSPFIVMEMVPGPTLREQPTRNRDTSLTLITQICAALEHAHQSGVIHRDLKPENVLLENGEVAKLVDFGLAQTVDMKSVESGMLAGTLAYVSPEQILGSELDGRTDLYSLGIIIYELITGELPFRSDEVLPILQKHLAETPVAPIEKVPDLPSDLNNLIISLLSKSPEDRPNSAWDVYRAIETMFDYEDNYLISLHADQRPAEQKHNLPTPPTSFIGRARELEELSELLANPDTRLLTILGAGGMGKTRLSIETGRAQLAYFEDGIYFIPLAPLKNSAQILFEIAEGVGLQFSQDIDPRQQLLEFFKHKQLLLVMDNYEHLLEGVEIIADILLIAGRVKVLVTSRQKLGLSLERIYRLGGLAAPGQRGDDSTRLFVERARQVLPSFVIDDDNFPAVQQVVRYVGGMPLGIELAASWVEIMSIEEIAVEMRESLDFLESELQDLPERHRNMRAMIDQTWDLLTLKEQNAFRSFGVFRGRFTRDAVTEITGIDAKLLRSLLNKSVIQRDQDGYYQIHELMRQYAEEKLAEYPGENEHTRDLHADFFCGLVAQHGEKILAGENYLIAPMYENIREAVIWSIAWKKLSNYRISVKGLLFYERNS
jgi:non-specific serine/threonine protein kinase